MKRTATTMMLLAGLGGGCVSPDGNAGKQQPTGSFGKVTRPMTVPGVQGPGGEPIAMTSARGVAPGGTKHQAQAQVRPTAASPGTLMQAGGFQKVGGSGKVMTAAHIPGGYVGSGVVQANGYGPAAGGPNGGSHGGILPVPGMGPPGAVAAFGAMVPGMGPAGVTGMRTSVKFGGPPGMKITWQLPGGGFNDPSAGLTVPNADYNFVQGQVYRLRVSEILPNFPGRRFYPTLEVSPANPKTITFLSHASVPVTFTTDDFDQAANGNMVVKVIYLPDPTYQDFAVVAAAEEIVSTRLAPGEDPVAEAQRRGTILAIIRMGNLDLENRASPAMNAPPGGGFIPPGGFPMRPTGNPPGLANVNSGPTGPVGPIPVPTVTGPVNGNLPIGPGPLPPGVNSPTSLPNINGK